LTSVVMTAGAQCRVPPVTLVDFIQCGAYQPAEASPTRRRVHRMRWVTEDLAIGGIEDVMQLPRRQ
jgi:hypothetical protein